MQAWAGHRDAPLLPAAAPRSIVTVNDLERLPLATDRLARLLRSETAGPDLGLTSVLASMTTLAGLSRASADALDAAQRDPTVGVPDLVSQASRALRTHADVLTDALREHRTTLGSTSTGSRATMAQARELASTALPRIRDLRARPARALAASPALIGYGAVVAQATAAARSAVTELNSRGVLMVRADSETVAYRGWHETRHVGGHEPLLDALDRATDAARRCPPDPSRAARPIAPTREPAASILGPELARQREQRRPAHPGLPVSPAQVASR